MRPVTESRDRIDDVAIALAEVHERVCDVLAFAPELPLEHVVANPDLLGMPVAATFTERDWRLIRYALATARGLI